ncbi:N-6 DNA methylase [Streptobacillus moniliformis]|uniref:N-6 DNA methylase n=1 Tax=Streptobacillus moniliformis TaxID=34105 RepID=UPI0007E35C2B|nr:N-6 DNA methylase [Streptobacillus moniliformis]
MSYSIKAIREEFKKKGVFYTPTELAEFMKSFIDFEVDEVYDPTCGHGGLFQVFDDNVVKYGQDINELGIEFCNKNITNFNGVVGDVLVDSAFKDKKFKCIMGNPPFSVNWIQDESLVANFKDYPRDKKGQPILPPKAKGDYAFNLHILDRLADNGKAVVINFPGILYRKSSEYEIRKWLVEQNYIETVVHIQGKKFEDTDVPTCLIIYNKNKKDTNIKFINTEDEVEYIATYEEVKENDFNLSVTQYAKQEIEKLEIDIDELNSQSLNLIVKNLKDGLELNYFLIKDFGANIDLMFAINEVKTICDEYEQKLKGVL